MKESSLKVLRTLNISLFLRRRNSLVLAKPISSFFTPSPILTKIYTQEFIKNRDSSSNTSQSYKKTVMPYSPKSWMPLLVIVVFISLILKKTFTSNEEKVDEELLDRIEIIFRLLQQGNITQLGHSLSQLINNKKQPQIEKAILLIESEKYQEGIILLEDFFKKTINKPEIFIVMRGVILNSLGEYEVALSHLSSVIENESQLPLYIRACAYYHKGVALEGLGHSNEAENCFSYAVELDEEVNDYKDYSLKIRGFLQQYFTFDTSYSQKDNPYLTEKKIGWPDKSSVINFFWGKQYYNPTTHLPLSTENRVTVRVWLPHNGSVGHVSLETNESYVSLWPTSDLKDSLQDLDLTNTIKTTLTSKGYTSNSLLEDMKIEKRLPDLRISLYGLDASKINACYEELITKRLDWRLMPWGSSDFNCSGLVAYLLSKGGMFNQHNHTPTNVFWTVLTISAAVEVSVETLAPICAKLANFIPVIGPWLSVGVENIPKLLPMVISGIAVTSKLIKTVIPQDIAEAVLTAKQSEIKRYADSVENKISLKN